MKPLLVGEVNPYGADPDFALYPLPERASGGRLAKILGLGHADYLRMFDRVNLCTGRWSAPASREAAREILAAKPRPLILLGAKVRSAFHVLDSWDWFDAFFLRPGDEQRGWPRVGLMPHPSGLNRLWHRPDAMRRARALLALLARVTT